MKAFFDIDTQLDFVAPGGALYGAGAERLLPTVATLNRYAGEKGIALISTTDAHSEDAEEFRIWPPHCVAGTFGQQKPAITLLSNRQIVPWTAGYDLDPASLSGAQQIVLEKNHLDFFTNPTASVLLNRLKITECVVYGIFIDYCVKAAIFGLLDSGRSVSLVQDASDHVSPEAGALVIQEFRARGGKMITSTDAMS